MDEGAWSVHDRVADCGRGRKRFLVFPLALRTALAVCDPLNASKHELRNTGFTVGNRFTIGDPGGEMDVTKALQDLYAEKRRLDTAIAALEEHLRGLRVMASPVRPGRRKMAPQKRLDSSTTISQYTETPTSQQQPT